MIINIYIVLSIQKIIILFLIMRKSKMIINLKKWNLKNMIQIMNIIIRKYNYHILCGYPDYEANQKDYFLVMNLMSIDIQSGIKIFLYINNKI